MRGREPRVCLRVVVGRDELRADHAQRAPRPRRLRAAHQLGRILETLLADYAAEQVRHHRRLSWLWRWRKVDVDKLATLRSRWCSPATSTTFRRGR